MKNISLLLILGSIAAAVSATALAGPMHTYTLTYQNGKFLPQKIDVPADTKFRLTVKNADAKPMEFESSDLNREHVITPGATWHGFIGPLDAGQYSYFNDFDRAAKGEIVAR